MKIKMKIIVIMLLITLIQIPITTKATEIEAVLETEEQYIITDTYILRIKPETTIEEFKRKFNVQDIRVYLDEGLTQELTSGYVGTKMFAVSGTIYKRLSVIGDVNGDGEANQIDLSLLIRHVLGVASNQLVGDEKKEAADLNGDFVINNADISTIIRYIAFGELTTGEIILPVPKITNINAESTIDSIIVTVTANDDLENLTYQYRYKKEGEQDYIDVSKVKENTYTINGLEQDTKYIVQVRAINKYGKVAEKEVEVQTVRKEIDITEIGVLEQKRAIAWSDDGTATIEFVTNTTYDIQYRVNDDTIWTTGSKVTDLNEGDEVHVRLWFGTEGSQFKTYTIQR